jgi:hypothetical protein
MSDQQDSIPETATEDYRNLQQLIEQQGVAAGLEVLEQAFRRNQQYPQLFEILKIKCRFQLGLPLIYGTRPEQLDDATQQQLEQGLIEACQEVGLGLLKAGQLEQSWLYLQPIGNRPSVAQALQDLPVHESHLETLIEICLGQAAAPVYGYQLVLEHFGICDGITTFDVQSGRFEPEIQRQMATILLRRFYSDLQANLVQLIRREGLVLSELGADRQPEQKTIRQLFEDYPALSQEGVHVIDATHLVSVVRISRIVTERADLRKAWELCQYGKQLHPDFHYPCPAPFESTFEDHSIFYAALLGTEVQEGVSHFRRKLPVCQDEIQDLTPLETLIDLFNRTNQRSEAIELLLGELSADRGTPAMITSLFQIAESAGHWERLRQHFQAQGDWLSYGISLLQERSQAEGTGSAKSFDRS